MADKAIFFDRDETIIEDPGYISDPEQVRLLPGVPDALIELRSMGYKLVIVSNQSAVARGIVTEEVLGQIHERLMQLLEEAGAYLDHIYYCPYHPDGVVPRYRRSSDMRKPSPGMLLEASKDFDIDLTESWMIGNSPIDIEAGSRAGCRTILLDGRSGRERLKPDQIIPDYRAVNLKEVVNIIKMHARTLRKPPVQVAPPVEPKPQPVAEPRPTPPPQQQEPPRQQEVPRQQEPPRQQEAPLQQEVPLQQEPPRQEEPTQQQAPPEQAGEQKPGEQLTTEQLLTGILDQLKVMRRTSMYGEFYISRFFAGVIQVLVIMCLLASIYFLLSPDRQLNPILITLGFAILLQLMALTFYMMQGPK
jgi:D,D-heptose 1,7-bisphosphate phosphatase